jgi:hypothetical protein
MIMPLVQDFSYERDALPALQHDASGVDLSDHQVMDMVDLRFRKFKAKKCCNKPMRIQVVSASLNKYTFTEKN